MLEHGLEAPEVAVAGASAPYRWVGIPDCTRPNVSEPTSTGFPGGR